MQTLTFRIRVITTAAVLLLFAIAPIADARHEKVFPSDTYAVLQVRDVASLAKQLSNHLITADLKKAGLAEYFEPGVKKIEALIDEAIATDPNKKEGKLLRFLKDFEKRNIQPFSGEIFLGLTKKESLKEDPIPFNVIGLIDTAIDEKTLEEFLEAGEFLPKKRKTPLKKNPAARDGAKKSNDAKEEIEHVTTTLNGVTLHEIVSATADEPPKSLGGWALVGKTFVFAIPGSALRDTVDAVQNGRKENLADSAFWKRGGDITDGTAEFAYGINGSLLAAELRAAIVAEKKKSAGNDIVEIVGAYDKLALDAVQSLWVSVRLTPDEIRSKAVLSYSEKRGLLTLLLPKTAKPLFPTFIPDLNTGICFSSVSYDGLQTWKNFEVLLAQALPTVKPMMDFQLSELKTKEGVDLREGLLENIGDRFTVFSGVPPPKAKPLRSAQDVHLSFNNYLFVWEVRDEVKLASLVTTLLGKINAEGGAEKMFPQREYMGVKIRNYLGDDLRISYALFDGKLFFGMNADNILEAVIAEIKNPQKLSEKNPGIVAALKRVPPTSFAAGFYDSAFVVNTLCSALELIFSSEEILSGKGGGLFLDAKKRPNANAIPWVYVEHAREGINEFVGEATLFRRETK
ncbi:MAG: hypothetical protein LBS59_08745 [Puniceicoccales bacterium]|jgi:hypothetical protein|nr:hypothetical protein [Puniceicoccales bacterium]